MATITLSSNEIVPYIKDLLRKTIENGKNKAAVYIGLSGGSMPKTVSDSLNQLNKENLPMENVKFFMVDERIVPLDDKDSNCGEYLKLLPKNFEKYFIPITNFSDEKLAAEEFEEILKKDKNLEISQTGFPIFDLLILGLGPDGHTCSLFPNHQLVEENVKWVAPISDSPKPPPRRVTITIPVINSAKKVVFLATGENKKNAIKEILINHNKEYPPSSIKLQNGTQVTWIIDHDPFA
ncbi:6-phosphogluconolactonase [Strongyloides ratti]|uniref:6-phosphogluconolactonase n=1 Tax=Strongyloides ratti TaxID=34506 RepID=A0A090KYE7_STRRB|nr:6-phosphogluconolactonase [Strongyloides ratti]CEF62466.1 6-phosphogluconolactonase [Strongyloides ratti]